MIQLKRIYEPPSADDDYRVLVDRLWPRGITKEASKLDAWMKDVTPSPELRVWFGHDPDRWVDFEFRYLAELKGPTQMACIKELRERGSKGTVTLLYAAKDNHHNHALTLLDVLNTPAH